jgi:ABC-type antimicrobial peptide transport system permease subunit
MKLNRFVFIGVFLIVLICCINSSPKKTLDENKDLVETEEMEHDAFIRNLKINEFESIRNYLQGHGENQNPDEFTYYSKYFIESGKIKPLSSLENIDKEKYDLIISYLPGNEIVENYYYSVSITIMINDTTKQTFTPEEYDLVKSKFEYIKDFPIERIEYGISFYEIFFNKYANWRGDPTGKCFTMMFNGNNEFIRRYYVR